MPSELNLTLGAVEIGALISSMLYGAVTVQLYTYSGRCKDDPLWLILLVTGIWILETLFTILSICWLFDVTISNFGNLAYVTAAPWTLDLCITFQGIVGAVVQSFFAYRVWKVSNTLLWPSLAWVGAIVRVALNISMTCAAMKTKSIVTFSDHYGWEVTTSLSVALSVDILNAAALSFYLSMMRSGSRRTTHMVDRLMVYSIETGLVTSITATCMLVTRLTMLDNYVWIGLFQVYAKLYSNSLMVSLNARAEIQDKYLHNVNLTSTVVHNITPNFRRTDTEGINIQMFSLTETGDPGRTQDNERKDLDNAQTSLNTPYKN